MNLLHERSKEIDPAHKDKQPEVDGLLIRESFWHDEERASALRFTLFTKL